jgi:hypothetical protein
VGPRRRDSRIDSSQLSDGRSKYLLCRLPYGRGSEPRVAVLNRAREQAACTKAAPWEIRYLLGARLSRDSRVRAICVSATMALSTKLRSWRSFFKRMVTTVKDPSKPLPCDFASSAFMLIDSPLKYN